uniref:restriction endonuclease subunit S n=1 Tax=Yoonia sp. TaxID=2212373 RepID=UPI0040478DAD|tara:strand:+ start:1572 stop:2735 length:1164 start_codon:yes stop_codon:yes gene_type:complete
MCKSWDERRLGDFGECKIGLTYSPDNVVESKGTLVLRSSNIRDGRLAFEDNVYVECRVPDGATVREGDILVCVRNGSRALIGKTAQIDSNAAGNAFGAFMAVFRSSINEYVFQLLNTEQFTRQVHRCLGATINQITNADLRSFKFLFPPENEQLKIVDILRTWDNALEKLVALSSAKEKRLRALRSTLLLSELRSNGQRRNWSPTRLSTVTHELTARNGKEELGRDYVMGVTKAQGVVPMREQTIARDISRYKRLPTRAFAYNPMRINVGSIAMNEASETVLVSPDYVVFGCNPDGIEPDYLDHLRKTAWWAHYINSGGSGSVRQRTYYADLAALRLPLPDIEEQREIVAILNAAKADLSSTEQMIKAVKLQKRGLMQKLLTGEWRV